MNRFAAGARMVAAALFVLAACGAAQAEKRCPSKEWKTALELQAADAVSVVRRNGPITSIVNSYGSGVLQQQHVFLWRGLVELWRGGGKRQGMSQPEVGLAKIFPLKSGDHHKFTVYEFGPDNVAGSEEVLELKVAGKENLAIGDCQYGVLKVTQIHHRNGKEINRWTSLYSPELELVLANRYDEGTPNETTVTYRDIRYLPED